MIVTLINSEEKNHPNIPTLLHAVLWIYRKEKWWDICNITKNVAWNEMHWNLMIFVTLAAQIFNMKKKDSSNLTEDNIYLLYCLSYSIFIYSLGKGETSKTLSPKRTNLEKTCSVNFWTKVTYPLQWPFSHIVWQCRWRPSYEQKSYEQ